jgi:hypothetical protein
MALHRTQSAVGVRDCLTLRDFAHKDFATLGEGDNRWGSASALRVCDDDGIATFEDSNYRVGGSEVNTDRFSHDVFLLRAQQHC